MKKIYEKLIYVFPAALFFSYHPIISLGQNETMNFELSIALIFLAIFDVVALVTLVKEHRLKEIFKRWKYLILPIFVSLSVIWSANIVRGFLTVVILWMVYLAAMSFIIMKDKIMTKDFVRNFWRWFFGASILVCIWCVVQCVLDVIGVPRECTLLCEGCVSKMFGFPHPNGFAIEPQFMGNLLLAPAITSAILYVKAKPHSREAKALVALMLVFFGTLFLTFSRGAIYAFGVAIIFVSVFYIVRTKKWRAMILWPVMLAAFLGALNMQGILAEVSSTKDTYSSGVAKVLNQLSLGIIDVRGDKIDEDEADEDDDSSEAIFDGYVAESTTFRVKMTNAAIATWRKDFKTAVFGVGIGGAGEAMYQAGEIDKPKEIVQNEYASLLLETGIIGLGLFVFTIALIVMAALKASGGEVVLALAVAYAVSLFFFSGLPNALHIYLVPGMMYLVMCKKK